MAAIKFHVSAISKQPHEVQLLHLVHAAAGLEMSMLDLADYKYGHDQLLSFGHVQSASGLLTQYDYEKPGGTSIDCLLPAAAHGLRPFRDGYAL